MAVVSTQDSSLVVQAAAGSGKTRVLVATYLRKVVEQGVQPDQILCVTFTKKAAAEMKRRIVEELRIAGKVREAQIAETGPIQTLHSFCERILRENALDAGIDPDFKIMGESDLHSLIEKAMRITISETPNEGPARMVIEGLSGKHSYGKVSENGQLLVPIRKALQQLRGTNVGAQGLRENHLSASAFIENAYQAIESQLPANVKDQLLPSEITNFWTRLRSAFKAAKADIPSWIPSAKVCETIYELEVESAEWSCGIADLAGRAWLYLEQQMNETQTFDFARLEAVAVEAIVQNSRIQHRIRQQYPVVLIDEGQDLNPIQDQLVQAIGGEFVLVVGDVKQSIYGFRQADVRLFERRMESTTTLDLPQNFRSAPGVLHTIDALFRNQWEGYKAMVPNSSAAIEGFEGTEIWMCDGFDQTSEWVADLCEEHSPNEIAILVRKGYQIADLNHRLEALGIPVRTVGTGRNYFLRLEVRDLANILEALSDTRNDFALLAVLRSPIVGLSLDAVVKLALAGEVASNLRSEFQLSESDQVKLTAFADWFESVARVAPRLSAWEVLSQLFAETPYWENLVRRPNGRQQLANVRKLFTMATERPELNPKQLALLLRELQALDVREGDAGAIDDGTEAVTIMTVHRSKGLEFPVVVLPATREKLKRNKTSFEIDREYGLIAFKPSKGASAICDWIAFRRQEMEMAEELRALYVAMTRSQKKLCVVAGPTGNGTIGQLIWNSLQPDSTPMPGLKIRRAPIQEEFA